MVQISHPYMTTVKNIALTRQTFFVKVMSLLFNMLSRFVTAFLSSIFYFVAAVTVCSDFGAKKIKSDTVPTFSPSVCHKVMGPDAMILVF